MDIVLPVDAFVTNFTMMVGGKTVVGKVEEKVKAEKIYNKVR